MAQEYWYKNLEINYKAGLGDKIPKSVLQGVLMHIGMMYDFGENSGNILSEIKENILIFTVSFISRNIYNKLESENSMI